MSAEIRELHTANNSNRDAEQELLDYLIWSMKHERDPHETHEDPIEVFRNEMKERIVA